MKTIKSLLALSLVYAFHTNAFAVGTESHGGVGVVCFKDGAMPLSAQVFAENHIVSKNWVDSVVTIDFYKASKVKGGISPYFKEVMANYSGVQDREKAYRAIRYALAESPALELALDYVHKVIFRGNWVDAGSPSEYGLDFSNDVGVLPKLPPNCRPTQVALRQEDVFSYDKNAYEAMDGFQQALLQIHEELYYIGSKQSFAHVSSVNTQLLLAYVLTEMKLPAPTSLDESVIQERDFYSKLKYYGFLGDADFNYNSTQKSKVPLWGDLLTYSDSTHFSRRHYNDAANSLIQYLTDKKKTDLIYRLKIECPKGINEAMQKFSPAEWAELTAIDYVVNLVSDMAEAFAATEDKKDSALKMTTNALRIFTHYGLSSSFQLQLDCQKMELFFGVNQELAEKLKKEVKQINYW